MLPLVATMSLLIGPLLLWRALYADSALASLPLVSLLVLLIGAAFGPARAHNRIWLQAVLAPDGWPARRFRGSLSALMRAGVFAAIAVPLLAWIALQGSPVEQVSLAATALLAAGLRLGARLPLAHWFRPTVGRLGLNALATWGSALLAAPWLIWVNWALVPRPMEYGQLALHEAILFGLGHLPLGAGIEAVLMTAMQVVDSLKLWAVAQFTGWIMPGVVYSVQAALVVWVVARAAALMADLVARNWPTSEMRWGG